MAESVDEEMNEVRNLVKTIDITDDPLHLFEILVGSHFTQLSTALTEMHQCNGRIIGSKLIGITSLLYEPRYHTFHVGLFDCRPDKLTWINLRIISTLSFLNRDETYSRCFGWFPDGEPLYRPTLSAKINPSFLIRFQADIIAQNFRDCYDECMVDLIKSYVPPRPAPSMGTIQEMNENENIAAEVNVMLAEEQNVDIGIPKIDIETTKVDIKKPNQEIEEPNVEINNPNEDIKKPKVCTEIPQYFKKATREFDIPSWEIKIPRPSYPKTTLNIDIPYGEIKVPKEYFKKPDMVTEKPYGEIEVLKVYFKRADVGFVKPNVEIEELQAATAKMNLARQNLNIEETNFTEFLVPSNRSISTQTDNGLCIDPCTQQLNFDQMLEQIKTTQGFVEDTNNFADMLLSVVEALISKPAP